jgi:trehalose-6-phosphate synthase
MTFASRYLPSLPGQRGHRAHVGPSSIATSNKNGPALTTPGQILWKPFHYELRDYTRGQAFEQRSWESYVAVNQRFAQTIAAHYTPGAVIWVNDYHLLLVPQMVAYSIANHSWV